MVVIARSWPRALARVSVRRTALVARRKDLPVARRGDVPVARRGDVPVARRVDVPVRVPRSTQVARRVRTPSFARREVRGGVRRERAVCARGPAALFRCDGAVPRRPSVSDGAVSLGRLGRGASLSPLAAGSRTQSLSHARRARVAERPSVCGDVF